MKDQSKNEDKKRSAPPSGGAGGNGSFSEPIGLVSRGEYDALKKKAANFEPQNDHWIIVIPCAGDQDWCEIGDNSALFYKNLVCEAIGAKVEIKDDLDSYYTQFEIGRCRTRGFETVIERTRKAGLLKAATIKNRCLFIELNKKVPEKTITQFRKVELEQQQGINEIAPTKPLDPVLYQMMLDTATRLHRLALRKMDRLSSETNGARIVGTMDMILLDYNTLSNKARRLDAYEKLDMWYGIQEKVQAVIVELQIISGEKLWKRKDCLSIGQELLNIRKKVEYRISRLEAKVKPRKTKKEEDGGDRSGENYKDGAAPEARSDRPQNGNRDSEDGGAQGVAPRPAS